MILLVSQANLILYEKKEEKQEMCYANLEVLKSFQYFHSFSKHGSNNVTTTNNGIVEDTFWAV